MGLKVNQVKVLFRITTRSSYAPIYLSIYLPYYTIKAL